MKKTLSLLLALCMMAGVIALTPVTASAAAPVGPSSTATWDFGTCDANGSGTYNGGSWSWVQSTKTLTLTNISHSTIAATALQLPNGATIVLGGANTITSTYNGNSYTGGIQSMGNLTITGSGILTATGGTTSSSTQFSVGLTPSSGFAISGGATVIAAGGTAPYSYGVHLMNCPVINDGALIATGDSGANPYVFSVSSGYKYYVNTTTAPSTTELTGNGTTTTVNASYKYVKIANLPPKAPAITGPTTMTLTQGYKVASTGVYTATGTPAPTVTKMSGDVEISWNDTTQKLEIAEGLAPGTYTAMIRATNGVGTDATLIFTLTVKAPPEPEPEPEPDGPAWWTQLLILLGGVGIFSLLPFSTTIGLISLIVGIVFVFI